jgi:hypothetical protein
VCWCPVVMKLERQKGRYEIWGQLLFRKERREWDTSPSPGRFTCYLSCHPSLPDHSLPPGAAAPFLVEFRYRLCPRSTPRWDEACWRLGKPGVLPTFHALARIPIPSASIACGYKPLELTMELLF